MKMRAITSPSPLKRAWLARAVVALLAASSFTLAPHAEARVFISVNIAPPLLPVYEQPPLPGPGYLWTPGYWAYADGGYYWVPGTWVRAPYVGALWTPGYWGWGGSGVYVFHAGYWGPHVGYYGGINYGFGYTGNGYYGGYWNRGGFYYNQAVNRFGGVRITNVYNRTVINNTVINRYSFNGPGGITRAATRQELAVARERHMGPTNEQVQQRVLASRNEQLRASVNHGNPPIAATPRAGVFVPKGGAVAPAAMTHAQASSHGAAATSAHGSGMGKGVSQSAAVAHHGRSANTKVNERSNRGMREPSARASAQGQRSEDKHETMVRHSGGAHQNAVMHTREPRQGAAPHAVPRQGAAPHAVPRQDRGGNKPVDRKRGN